MKIISHFTGRTAAGAVALAVAMLAIQASAESIPQAIEVLQVKGHARYSTDNKTWHNLSQGDILDSGVVIQTATHSSVDIQIADRALNNNVQGVVQTGNASPYAPPSSPISYAPEESRVNVIRIFESTVLAVDKITLDRTAVDEVADTQLDLRAGHILGDVKKLSAASKYEIKIPNGVAGIRGSRYHLWATGELHMLSGSAILALVGPDGTARTWLINAHFGFNPTESRIFPLTGPGDTFPDFPPPPHGRPTGGPSSPPYCPPPISPVR